MRIALCDDEKHYIDHFSNLLRSIDAFSYAQIDLYTQSISLLDAMKKQPYDIVFLDIDLPEINGIDLGKHIFANDPKTIIVFVTNHDQYAIDAFDCDACGYLLKNCDTVKFTRTIEKVLKRYRMLNKYIQLTYETGTVTLAIDDIFHIEYVGRKCSYYTANGIFTIRKTLQSALSEIEEFGFAKIHQYRIVNLSKIRSIQKTSVQLIDDSTLELSRYRHEEVLEKYIKFRKEALQ